MTIYDYLWLSMTIYDYLWLSMTIYDYLWLSMTTYDYLWLSMTISIDLSVSIYLYLSICIYLSVSIYLYLSVSICIYLYLSVSICIYLYLSVSICVYLYLSVSICIYLYLSVSICIYLYLSVSICIYISVSICIYLYLSVSIFLSIFLSIYLSIYLSIHPFIHPFIHPSIHSFIHLYPSPCPAIYPFIWLSMRTNLLRVNCRNFPNQLLNHMLTPWTTPEKKTWAPESTILTVLSELLTKSGAKTRPTFAIRLHTAWPVARIYGGFKETSWRGCSNNQWTHEPHLKTQVFWVCQLKVPSTQWLPKQPGPGTLRVYEAMNHSQQKKSCNGSQSPQQKSDSHAILGHPSPSSTCPKIKCTPRHQECHSWVWKLISKAKEKGDKSWTQNGQFEADRILEILDWCGHCHPHV